jgi:cell division protein ZapD
VLRSIETAFSTLIAVAGKTGQHLRENEWLMAIKQRSAIPGGVCEFDLPSYHHWLNREVTTRRVDLMTWLQPLLPVAAALRIVLRVLRESGKSTKLVANQGVFQQMPMERAAHMLRLTLSADLACVPEISANKYALNVRFIQPATVQRSKVFDSDVSFELVYCNL